MGVWVYGCMGAWVYPGVDLPQRLAGVHEKYWPAWVPGCIGAWVHGVCTQAHVERERET